MKTYHAVMLHGNRDAEGKYEFQGEDALLDSTPVRIMRKFMEHVEAHAGLGHIDYEINAAMKNSEKGVVTVLGELVFNGNDHQPFVCMIDGKS